MATTGQDAKSGSLNQELFQRTLRYVSSADSTQDASTRDAQDAVLDSLPPQARDPRDQVVVPGVRPRSSAGDSSGMGLFDDSDGFHDWKSLYQDRHRFYMWLHTYLDEAKLHYCKPTVPLLEVKNNADDIYNKKRQ